MLFGYILNKQSDIDEKIAGMWGDGYEDGYKDGKSDGEWESAIPEINFDLLVDRAIDVIKEIPAHRPAKQTIINALRNEGMKSCK